jgi:hypothetical protein
MIQNLRSETAWHLRGSRRVGMSMEDVELVQQCVCVPFLPFFPPFLPSISLPSLHYPFFAFPEWAIFSLPSLVPGLYPFFFR